MLRLAQAAQRNTLESSFQQDHCGRTSVFPEKEKRLWSVSARSTLQFLLLFSTGDAKSEDTANKEAGEEKPEEDNDYHRSDEQVRLPQVQTR